MEVKNQKIQLTVDEWSHLGAMAHHHGITVQALLTKIIEDAYGEFNNDRT